MKVLLVTSYFYPKVGGVENHTFNIAVGLEKRGHDVVVVTSNDKGRKKREEIEGVRVIRLLIWFTFSNTPFNPMWYFAMRKIIKFERPDVIEAHAPVPGLADVAFLCRRNVPFVIKYHSGSMKKGKRMLDTLLGAYEYLWLKRMLLNADDIMSVYPNFVRNLIGENKQVHFIPPGLDPQKFKPLKTNKKDTDILYVGRIEKASAWKGIGTLIRAVSVIAADNPSITLKLVGSGDAVTDFKHQVEQLGLQKNVRFAGNLHDSQLVAAYNSARILVLPSETDSEAFSNSLMESMACGTPVIGTSSGGTPNVITDKYTGLLVAPKQERQLARAITELLNNPDRMKELATRGRNHARENFTLKKLIEDTEKVLLEVAQPRVIQVVPKYPPSIGGMQQRVRDLSERLAEAGSIVRVFASDQGTYPHIEKHGSLEVNYLRSAFIAQTPFMPALFFKLIRLKKNNIMHVHVAQVYVPEVAFLAAKIRHLPYIAHIRLDTQASTKLGIFLAPYKRFVLGPILRRADAVIVLNDDYKTLVRQKYGVAESSIHVIPNATDFPLLKYTDKFSKKPIKILLVGRLSKQKNIPLLIEATSRLKSRKYNIEVSIAGTGPQESAIKKQIARYSLEKEFKLLGSLDRKALIRQYRQADIIAQTSTEEGFSTVLIEAMASAKPLIASDIPGTRNIIKDNYNGLLIDPKSVGSLEKAIETLVGDEALRRKLVCNGQKEITKYDWKKIIASTKNVYTKTARVQLAEHTV